MIAMPKGFVMTRYPGYYWNVDTQKLYSTKVTGELRPMAFHKGGFFRGYSIQPGYQISVNGYRKTLTLDYLRTLKYTDSIQEIKVNEKA